MNDLLRLANELTEARKQVLRGDWDYIGDYTEYFDNSCTVIEGYQDLLRRILDTFNGRRPYQYGALVGQLSTLLHEARESIPEE